MRFVKLGLISVFILFTIATCIGLLLPSSVIVSRASDISAPKDSLLLLVNNIYEWKKWVNGMDKNTVHIISAREADLNGTHVTITSTNNYVIESKWTGKNGTTQLSTLRIVQYENSNNAVVQWQFVEELKWYPWQRLGSMVNEAVMGSQLEINLANLKKIAEKN
jgi:hypothetical protein